MNRQKLHWLIDWGVISVFLVLIWFCSVNFELYEKTFNYAPVYMFLALGVLYLNHFSLWHCFRTKDIEFFLMSGGILLAGINMILVKSNIGAIFTLIDFLLILYLADKICFDRIQLGTIAVSGLFIWFYWQFINSSSYGNTIFNPNGVAVILFSCFCVFVCYSVYLLDSLVQLPKWVYPVFLFLLLCLLTKRVWEFWARGVLAAVLTWAIAYYILPKKKYIIPIVIGSSLLIPAIYVLMWKAEIMDGIIIFNKRLASGRDIIWYEFAKVFFQHPITGIGSNFELMLPDLYLKEVHHALLDLLFVHGIPVFCIVLYFLYKRIRDVVIGTSGVLRAVCLASIYGMIAVGTFENYYILAPYNIPLFVIFILSNVYSKQQKEGNNT